MAKTAPIAIRLEPQVKEALERAAKADERSLADYVQRALVALLRAKGFLPPSDAK